MSKLASYVLAARPKTLTASIIPVWAGCMVVWRITGNRDVRLALFTLLSTLCIQIACNLFNDAIDNDKQADTSKRKGPKRMTASGSLTRKQVLLGGGAFLLLASLFALPLIDLRGWPIIAIGIPSLFFAYGYTGGPYPLAYKGLGEIFVILFFGLIAVLGTILVQIGTGVLVPGSADILTLNVYNAGFVLGIQCGLLAAVMISINNLRDRKEDATTGKNTQAVRLGSAKARGMTIAFVVAAYVTLPTSFRTLGISIADVWWKWIPVVLLAGLLILKIKRTPESPKLNKVLALASVHLIVYLLTYTLS